MTGKGKKRNASKKTPAKWYELEALVGEERTISFEDNRFNAREDIPGVLIFQVSNELANYPQRLQGIMKALQETLIGAGVNMPLIMMPSDARFARFRECDVEKARELDQQLGSTKQTEVGELRHDTKTMGNA